MLHKRLFSGNILKETRRASEEEVEKSLAYASGYLKNGTSIRNDLNQRRFMFIPPPIRYSTMFTRDLLHLLNHFQFDMTSESRPLRILYEAGPCFVVYKPAGLSTQAPAGIESLEVQIKNWLRDREQKTGNVYLGVPHRLDRPVSGALVVARHVRACRRLSEQFEDRLVGKSYWACVAGEIDPTEGRWTDWLYKVPGRAHVEVVAPDHTGAQAAVLNYRVLGKLPWGTWLEITLETGRTHQIRVQCAARGAPILGDVQYGANQWGSVLDDPREQPIALHARRLEFRHPMTKEPVRVIAPLPETWRELELSLAGLAADDPNRSGEFAEYSEPR